MTRDMDAVVERAAELFHEHRRGHYGFKPWAEADAAQKNHARGLMLRTAKHALAAADELAQPDPDAVRHDALQGDTGVIWWCSCNPQVFGNEADIWEHVEQMEGRL